METRTFNKTDWYGYAGASRGPNGEEPLIGEMTLDLDLADVPEKLRGNVGAVCILSWPEAPGADAAIEVSVDCGVTFTMAAPMAAARAIVKLLPGVISATELVALGFEDSTPDPSESWLMRHPG